MVRSTTVIPDWLAVAEADAIFDWPEGPQDLTGEAEVIAEAEAVLVDAMFEEIVRDLRVARSSACVTGPERDRHALMTEPSCTGRRLGPLRTVQKSVRSPPETNRR